MDRTTITTGLWLIAVIALAASCASTPEGNGSGSDKKTKTVLTVDQEEIKQLLLTFRDVERWKQSRQELYDMGPEAHQYLFRFLFRLLTQEPDPAEMRRIEREYARALLQTRYAPGAEGLCLVAVNRKGGSHQVIATTRAAVVAICEQAHDAVLVRIDEKGETQEISLREMLANVHRNLSVESLPEKKANRDRLVTARITILRMMAAARCSDSGLGLIEFYEQLEALSGWQHRARLAEAMEGFRGEESMQVLERGAGDPDDNVRAIAAEVMTRRRRLERRAKREADRRRRSGGK